MNIKKTLFAALLATVSLGASAQEEAKTEYVFKPHWYIQGQIGGQYTLGEIDFDKLLSPNAQIAVGYNFGKVVGGRLSVNGWQSKAGSTIQGEEYKWKWYYVAPSLEATFNISNLISGVNPNRLVDITAFIGGGVNFHWKNNEAVAYGNEMYEKYKFIPGNTLQGSQILQENYIWEGTKATGVGRAGLIADFKVSKKLFVNAEVNANFTSDRYNSKRAGNADWYFNALVGVKYNLGDTYTEKKIEAPQPQIIYRDRIVEKIVEKPVEVKAVEKDPLRIDVFFTIASTKLVGSEAQKVNEVANYLNKYPEAKVTVTGYADKGTGNTKINKDLSIKRADIVKNELIQKYGIAADRIITDAKGDTVQPFDVEVLNRVSICIAK